MQASIKAQMIADPSFDGLHMVVPITVYVDDMILNGNDAIGIKELKIHLLRTFKMKDLGPQT